MSDNMKKMLITGGVVFVTLLVYDLSKPLVAKILPKKA
jgi:hypothetical protein